MNPVNDYIRQGSTGGGRAVDPIGAILGSIGNARSERRQAQLGLEVYAAKKNMDLNFHDELAKRHSGVLSGLDPNVVSYETSPLGGLKFRRAEPKGNKQDQAAPQHESQPQASTSIFLGHPKATNVPAPTQAFPVKERMREPEESSLFSSLKPKFSHSE
jgi:hypothetical protein